ncbi:MAG: thioredoxin domain-containing protein [Anaerolineae bacterium]|nr:thioredoxin domain-containing protein [Anaerolineae bacterium]
MAQSTTHDHTYTNRLIHETSPYLLQHAHNPVDWYPWGDEALARARAEDKPILLSVGYSACHWCHVMERESFENPDTAALMNRHFVNIKVDREERPDVDAIYMEAVQLMTNHGGWPMTVFLTPDGVPFYGGTYFPPSDRHGLPGFPRLLEAITNAWQTQREGLAQQGAELVRAMDKAAILPPGRTLVTESVLDEASRQFARQFDARNGGLGSAPKFPQASNWEFILRTWRRTGDETTRTMVERTLRKMAYGGIYDHLGGGFHRYTVDAIWLVPHFEKMLYDNALLARLYLHAYQAFGDDLYRRVVEETLEYVRRDMTDPAGGFYSAEDADSEGEEGKFYVWSYAEVQRLLGPDADAFCRFYDVTPDGNWEEHNILHMTRPVEVAAQELGLDAAELDALLTRGRAQLFEARSKRVRPGLDDKVLLSWNALMLAAYAEAGAVLNNSTYLDIAVRNAEFLLRELQADGRLLRTWKAGQAKILGFQEDYAYLIHALLVLYEATFDRRWVQEARRLAQAMLTLFWDDDGGFYQTGADQGGLVTRPMDLFDSAIPSGNAVGADVLLRLGHLLGDETYMRKAGLIFSRLHELTARAPTGFGALLSAMDRYLAAPREVAILGDLSAAATQALLAEARRRYQPNRLLVAARSDDAEAAGLFPLLEERDLVNGQPTAYVCQNYACQLPTTDPTELARQLDNL